MEGAFITWFDDIVKLEVWDWRIGEASRWEHVKVRYWEAEVGELGFVFAIGGVPCMDLAVFMAGEEGGIVVADLDAEGRG